MDRARSIVLYAFESGVTHFDLANNYGPPPGAAEETFSRILRRDLQNHRDELIIATKAGWPMWPGRYGDWGSRKHLIASLDQSLRRLGLDYVDIFYHHRPDPRTPLEETMGALEHVVRTGRSIYVGISSYSEGLALQAAQSLRSRGTPCLVHQLKYNMVARDAESGVLASMGKQGIGCVAFSPLAEGLLTNRYLAGIPADSRAARQQGTLGGYTLTPDLLEKIRSLSIFATQRGYTLAQLSLAWILRQPSITSAIVGASSLTQIEDAIEVSKSSIPTLEDLSSIQPILDSL